LRAPDLEEETMRANPRKENHYEFLGPYMRNKPTDGCIGKLMAASLTQ
jgi:hypothetical protein